MATRDNIQPWQLMIAGSFAGSVENIALYPVHTVRRHMLISSFEQKPVELRQAFLSIFQMMRPYTPHRWMLSPGASYGVYFSIYEVSKKLLPVGNPNNSAVHAVSGVFAALSSGLVSTPMEMVKMRLHFRKEEYKGVWDCVKRVTHQEGIGAFYTSYSTRIMTYGPYSAVHFATYETAKRRLMEKISPERKSWLVHATAGAAAGGLGVAVTMPLRNVIARMSTPVQSRGAYYHLSWVTYKYMFRSAVKFEGLRGLFRGCLSTMLLHAPATAICWSSYEAAKSFFQDLNGDSSTA